MSIRSRGLVFATFFGSCLVIGLLIACLVSEHWIVGEARKDESKNHTRAFGKIHFGLFSGKRELNTGIGMRPENISVLTQLRDEPSFMSYWLWLGTFLGTGFGLFASAVAAITSVIKAASEKKKPGIMVLMVVSNSSSAISQIFAFLCWLTMFYQYLKHNLLPQSYLQQSWHTRDMSWLGHSFYFVVAGVLVVIVNLVILYIVIRIERKERRPIRREDPVDEKMVGAIMLY